jgi:hypothetical protein
VVQAMAALLNGPAWDPAFIAPSGQAFTWCGAVFCGAKWTVAATAPLSTSVRMALAQTALRQLLLHNPHLVSICLDRCYSAEPAIADNYFSVFADVAATLHTMTGATGAMAPHELLALVLTKLIDSDPGMRLRALDVLHVIASSQWTPQSQSGTSAQLPSAVSISLAPAVCFPGPQSFSLCRLNNLDRVLCQVYIVYACALACPGSLVAVSSWS